MEWYIHFLYALQMHSQLEIEPRKNCLHFLCGAFPFLLMCVICMNGICIVRNQMYAKYVLWPQPYMMQINDLY